MNYKKIEISIISLNNVILIRKTLTEMFFINTLETVTIATSVMAVLMTILCCSELFSQIDNALTKLKEERKLLKVQMQTLEKEVEKNKNNKNNFDVEEIMQSIIEKKNNVSSEDINHELVDENRRLRVRCDMLEEELLKTRENNKKTYIL